MDFEVYFEKIALNTEQKRSKMEQKGARMNNKEQDGARGSKRRAKIIITQQKCKNKMRSKEYKRGRIQYFEIRFRYKSNFDLEFGCQTQTRTRFQEFDSVPNPNSVQIWSNSDLKVEFYQVKSSKMCQIRQNSFQIRIY